MVYKNEQEASQCRALSKLFKNYVNEEISSGWYNHLRKHLKQLNI